MANTVRIKRRITGAAGAPAGLKNAELAYNEIDNILYYGKGDTGDGSASTIIQIGGSGAFATTTYVDNALTNSNLSQYAKLAASNTFDADFTNKFNGTLNAAGTFQIGGVSVTSSAAELNILDGVTASYDEINLLDGAVANTVVNSKAVIYSNAGAIAAGSITTTGSASVGTGFDAASNNFKVDSSANVTVGGNLTVSGNITVNGTTTAVNSSVTTLDDPIITLGGDTVPTSNDNKDRGVEFRWHNGTAAKIGFFGYDASAGRFAFIPDASNSSEVFSGSAGDIEVNGVYIGGTQVLSSNTLGSGVTASSLTSVGTISSGTWQGTAVGVSYGGTGATTASGARTNLGLAIGTDVQAYNSTLAAVAAGTYSGDDSIVTVGTISSGTWQGTAVGVSYGGTGATTASGARTNLGLVIGTDVQAYDTELAALAGLSSAADRLPYFTGSGAADLATFTSFGRSLVDDATASDARTTLGLGTIATQNANNVSITGGTIDNVVIDGGVF